MCRVKVAQGSGKKVYTGQRDHQRVPVMVGALTGLSLVIVHAATPVGDLHKFEQGK